MGALVPLLVPLFVVGGTAAWVHRDATRFERDGSPVVFRSRFITLDSPQDWAIACLVGWLFFFPLYVVGRTQDL